MVKLKLNSLSEKTIEFPQYENERLSEIFARVYGEQGLEPGKFEKYFKILINGQEIERDLWAYIKPKQDALVLIVLVPQGGDIGRILGQVALTVALIYVNVVTGGSVAWLAATAIGGSLLLNQLFPPPTIDLGGASKGYNQEDSQMYTVSNQTNRVKKYGFVPKVYGRHRVFPNVAGNPYTQFESKDGELVQYFYALYDLGFGPMLVDNLKIGDTNFELFEDAFYRLVDFNKPSVDEGPWDQAVSNKLLFYKGDNSTETVQATIDINSDDDGAVEDDWTVIRNADENPNSYEQEIIVDIVFPQGLNTIGTNGEDDFRSVELNVEFAEVGTNIWRGFNDLNYVDTFLGAGNGVDVTVDSEIVLDFKVNIDFADYFQLIRSETLEYNEWNLRGLPQDWTGSPGWNSGTTVKHHWYGYKKGSTEFYSSSLLNINSYVRLGDQVIGRIKSATFLENYAGRLVYKYEFYAGIPFDILVFTEYEKFTTASNPEPYYYSTYLNEPPFIETNVFRVERNTNGAALIRAMSQNPVYGSIKFTPKTRNQVKVRIRRIRSFGGYDYRIFDSLVWSSINTRFNVDPVVTDKRHVFLEVKIKATDQLNGTIRNLSAECSSILDVYNDTTGEWEKEESSNPAWIFADILTGAINKRAIDKSRLDTDSLLEWAEFCDEIPAAPPPGEFFAPRFSCNFIQDTNITVSQLISQLTATAQASLNIINGKYGVLVDKLKTIPVQVFTPRNSWDFSSTRTYGKTPQALKIKFVDPAKEWGVYEEIVYNDGQDENNTTEFEELNAFACTNHEQAWRFGRYFLFSAILRQENITITVDYEHLVCTRGDFVKLQHDVMKVGGRPARVKTVSGSEITIDDTFITEIGINYGYTFRNSSGIFTGTMTILDSDTADLAGDIPNVGDLLVWGEVEKITIDCLVKAITPNDDYSAKVLLIEKADEVYEAESSANFPIYDPQIVENLDSESQPPPEVDGLTVSENTFRCGDGDYEYYIYLTWNTPNGAVIDNHEIYVDRGNGFELVDVSTPNNYEYIVDGTFLGTEHRFKVLGVAANGSKLSLGDVTAVLATPLFKTAPPSDVDALYINVTNESLTLDWDQVEDCDIENYLIRYSPNLSSTWNSSIPLQVVDRNTSLATVQARVGSYFIKAIDWNGNESVNAAIAITSIPALVNVNIIEETNDFPDLFGVKDLVQKFGSELILQEQTPSIPGVIEYYPVGYYYYENLLDLGEIYTVRLQSLIEAEGFSIDDLMVNWTTLADVDFLTTSSVSDWSVETEYRATDLLNVMAEWTSLDAIDPISEGVQSAFTPWRRFTIGDFTGRVFQFRLKLISNQPNISPRVFDGIIKADMPDRVENYNNLLSSSGQYDLTYVPAFKGPGTTPNIQITIDDAEQGDYYQLENKTLEGFTIKFYDNGNNPVDRQFDVLVKGYGRKQIAVI